MMRSLVAVLMLAVASCAQGSSTGVSGPQQLAHRRALHQHGTHQQQRQLLASERLDVAKQCEWDSVTKTCDAADAVNIMYAVRDQPLSAYLGFLLMTHDRQHICDSHASRDACRSDAAHNCVWLEDVLGDGSSGSSSSSGRGGGAKKSAAEVTRGTGGAVRDMLRERLASVQRQAGAALRDMLSRAEAPALTPSLELQQGQPAPKPAAAAGSKQKKPAAAPARSGSSSRHERNMLCASNELLENFAFTKTGYSNVLQAPLAMHCPGSKAADLLQCMRQPTTAACAATPGCIAVPRTGVSSSSSNSASKARRDVCVSKYFDSLSSDQLKKFMFDLTLAEPSVVGSCDGACWMRQAMLCNHTTDAASCSALSFCRPMGKACVPKLYNQDNFGASVQEYLGECVEVDNKADCEALSIKLVNRGHYAAWAMQRRPTDKCYIPSVAGILGGGHAARVAKEGGPRAELLTVVGAQDERQAATSAAATASADAAKVARLMSERGPSGLQQLFASLPQALAGE